MEMKEEAIIHKLPVEINGNIETLLQEVSNSIISKLERKFGDNHEILCDTLKAPNRIWTQEIKIKKGHRIGAMVDLRWETRVPSILKIEVEKFSKLESTITYTVSIVFLAIGCFMGANHIEPLDFLPDSILGVGFGGLLALIPGGLIIRILKSIFLRGADKASNKLVLDVRSLVSE